MAWQPSTLPLPAPPHNYITTAGVSFLVWKCVAGRLIPFMQTRPRSLLTIYIQLQFCILLSTAVEKEENRRNQRPFAMLNSFRLLFNAPYRPSAGTETIPPFRNR